MQAHMALWALRSALTRQSYVVGLVADEVGRLLPSLPTGDLRIMETDLGADNPSDGSGTWFRLLMLVRNEIEKRGDR